MIVCAQLLYTLFYFTMFTSFEGVNVTFERSTYVVFESNQAVRVCVILTGQLLRPVSFSLTTIPSTAHDDNNDFTEFATNILTENSGDHCVNIGIMFDNVVENTEDLTVRLSTDDFAVNIVQSTANIMILDSSTVALAFDRTEYSVLENSSQVVCVQLFGSMLDRNIAVYLEVNSRGMWLKLCSCAILIFTVNFYV